MSDQCYAESDALATVDEVLALLKRKSATTAGVEEISLDQASGRILAQDISSEMNLPPFTNAAVDGYAVAAEDLQDLPATLPVSLTITAGTEPAILARHSAAQIMTGAPLPENADTVVMQEAVSICGSEVRFEAIPERGANCRPAGEDLVRGQQVLRAGTRLDFSDIGILASLGLERIPVYRALKIALFSSGDEIAEPGRQLAAGQRYDANRPMLKSLLQHQGFDVVDCGVLPDTLPATEQALQDAAAQGDAIVTSGGASTGAADYLTQALRNLGHLDAWRLALKPGRPFAFGHLQKTPVICLPGNPVAVGVCTLILVLPFLAALAGRSWPEPAMYPLSAGFSMKKKAGRTEYIRAVLVRSADGVQVNRYPKQGSGVLMSMVESDGLVFLPAELQEVKKGDVVSFIPFDQYVS